MCGIAGFFHAEGFAGPPENVLHAMADAMRSRGPDGEGFFSDGNLGLAHRRLSVIDLNTGSQPMSTEDGRYTIVFNGEIFNFRELRADLEAHGHVFRTQSDTEVILEQFRRDGLSAVEKLNGFFAFALYDKERKRLVLARDRLGVKPLFYFHRGFDFAFASSLSALKCHGAFSKYEFDLSALADYLAFQYIPGTRTIYHEVSRLAPGHTLVLNMRENEIAIHKYWDADHIRPASMSYPDAMKELRSLLADSVERRLVSDVPLGVFLSGGLDSAIVAALAARKCNGPLQCFSIAFQDPAYDESAYAKESAEFIRKLTGREIRHEIETVNPCDLDILKSLADEFGEPYADASMLPTFLLSKFTRQSVTVALSGDGADELFGGYDRYRAMHLMRTLPLPRGICRLLAGLLPPAGERTAQGRLRRFLTAASLAPSVRYRFLMTHGADAISQKCATEMLREHLDPNRCFHSPSGLAEPDSFPLNLDLHTYLPGDVLCKVDVCSMANSLEVRSPFLDFRVAEFAASLPFRWKVDGPRRKRILADAFEKDIVPGLASRKKRGFGVPLAAWFRKEWNPALRDRLLSGGMDRLFERNALERLIRSHENNEEDFSYYLFSLLMLSFFTERA